MARSLLSGSVMVWTLTARPENIYRSGLPKPATVEETPFMKRLAIRLRARWGRPILLALAGVALPALALATALTCHVYFDRSHLPNLDAFIRFDLPMIGEVKDARGNVLIELAHEYRRVVSYDDVPQIVRQAILATEDKNFFDHRGIEYRSLPRVVVKAVEYTFSDWRKGGPGSPVRLPQGGSTLTQQLVRGYFLRDEISRERGKELLYQGVGPRLLAGLVGVAAANKLSRKLEEIRLALWLERQMRIRYGSKEQAKREIFARYANFIYLGNGRYGFAAASEYYFNKPLKSFTAEDAGKAALLAGIAKAPREYAPGAGALKPLRRRNFILAQMATNGDIPATAAKKAQEEPIVTAVRRTTETEAPAAIQNVFDELKGLEQGRFSMDDLVQGRIMVSSTVDQRIQAIVNEALENGLAQYERRHPKEKGLIQGSVVVLKNADAAVLAQAGGRRTYNSREARYFDLNRATGSLRQAGSTWKPLVYLAAFASGLTLDTPVLDEPVAVPTGSNGEIKWIANYDHEFKGAIPLRQALAESRNSVAVRLAYGIGLERVARLARALGIRSPIQPYITASLGASEVRLLELAGIYRAMASGLVAEPHVVDRVTDPSGNVLYEAPHIARDISAADLSSAALQEIQEGLRGVVRLASGTANALNRRDFPIPVMGKTGTTSDFRDALFVGSTYGSTGITVAVRIGFDDNRSMGPRETGGRSALPVFREIMLRIYKDALVGPAPRFPSHMESRIDAYIAEQALLQSLSVTPLL